MAILPIFIPHAGCPHQCVFCNQRTISGQQLAALPAARAQADRWRQWLRPSPANEVAFYGGSFTALPLVVQKELLALADTLLAEGLAGSVRLSTRPDYINDEILQLLKCHNVQTVELGAQSLDDAVLQAAERGHTAAQVQQALALLKRYGFSTGLQLMVGLPLQDFASVKRTVLRTVQLAPAIARIYPLLVIKNTPLAAQYAAGTYVPLTLDEAVEQAAWAYSTLTEAGINVIRTGLQADEELCAPGNIIAGPFHPALGELVQSRVLRDKLTPRIAACAAMGAGGIKLLCPPHLQSKLRGQKNCNLHYWRQIFPGLQLYILPGTGTSVQIEAGSADN